MCKRLTRKCDGACLPGAPGLRVSDTMRLSPVICPKGASQRSACDFFRDQKAAHYHRHPRMLGPVPDAPKMQTKCSQCLRFFYKFEPTTGKNRTLWKISVCDTFIANTLQCKSSNTRISTHNSIKKRSNKCPASSSGKTED